MNQEQFDRLRRGAIIRHRTMADSYVVSDGLGHGQHIAVRTIVVSNAMEWDEIDPETGLPIVKQP